MVAVPKYMQRNARRGLELLEFKGPGLEARTIREARQIASGDVSEQKVARMAGFFQRHVNDHKSERARDYVAGRSDRPSPGQVSWLLWGGDIAESTRFRAMEWAIATRDRLRKDISDGARTGLQNKVDEHNEKYGDVQSKRVTLAMLEAVFRRGVGAYNTNPSSVRPGVRSSDQWAMARVNTFLGAVRTGRFPSGKFDMDLLPKGHPLSTRKAHYDEMEKEHISYPDGEPIPHALPDAYGPAEGAQRCDNCKHYKIGACLKWGAAVRAGYWCKAWKPLLGEVNVELEHNDEHETVTYERTDDEAKSYGYDRFRKEIVEEDGRFCVYSEGRGRKFGCYPTRAAAAERLEQIESFSYSLESMTEKQLRAAHEMIHKADTLTDDLRLAHEVIEDHLEAAGFAPPYTTGDLGDKYAALSEVVPFAKAEDRYTLGPVYVPGRIDGHGEFIMSDTLQKAIWDWVRSGDRTIYLQHSEKAAGEMVEILTWPMPIQTSLTVPGETVHKVEFPPDTPFMGVVWESWAWDLVKAGQLRGYSIGGKARRVEADLSLETSAE